MIDDLFIARMHCCTIDSRQQSRISCLRLQIISVHFTRDEKIPPIFPPHG